MRAKTAILQTSFFHVCGISKKELSEPALFRAALEDKGFIVVESCGPIGNIEIDDYF